MASRKDAQGRVLHTGETQRKNGSYEYRYVDPISGKRVSIYKPTLNELREEEKKIQKMVDAQMDTLQGNRLLEDQMNIYFKTKLNRLRDGSKKTYETAINTIKASTIAKIKIRQVTTTQVKLFCIDLHNMGLSRDYIKLCYTLLRHALQMGYEDGHIVKNPCNFKLGSILPEDDREFKMPLTNQEKQNLLLMLSESTNPYDEFYYPATICLLETGMRIGEFRGLRTGDIDFENRIIHVHHQLTREGKYTSPKTKNSVRKIPMTDRVVKNMKYLMGRAEEIREKKKVSYAGYNDFIMLSKRNGAPISSYNYARTFNRFADEYKKRFGEDIAVTPHICRHTFCSDMCAAGLPPKSLQKLMGHANFQISMDNYTDLEFSTVKADFMQAAKML